MKVVFRVDAPTMIGAGHAGRCLVLAAELRKRGVTSHFVSREAPGHVVELIGRSGYEVTRLPALLRTQTGGHRGPHSLRRVGARTRSERVRPFWQPARIGWWSITTVLIRAGTRLRGSVRRVMVIDDLANRRHDCDVLLDQNFTNPRHERYSTLVPYGARQFLGSRYALVRPEFAELRQSALERRNGRRGRLFVSMGASDPPNDTAKALAGLKNLDDLRLKIDVVVGQSNPWKNELRELCAQMPLSQLHVRRHTSRIL